MKAQQTTMMLIIKLRSLCGHVAYYWTQGDVSVMIYICCTAC